MEDDLDEIADGRKRCRSWIASGEFKHRVDFVDKSVTREDVSEARDLGPDLPRQADIGALRQYGPFVHGTKDDEENRNSRACGRISAWTP